ncbi:hypothetical protein HY627_02540 [Candidatus Uhrbacteria bacterium]|nr:hypothetical protein [Candidatus Uhrbacteria bacterium]
MLVDFLTSKYHHVLERAWSAFEIGAIDRAEAQFSKIVHHHSDPKMMLFDLADAHAGLGAVAVQHKDFFEATRWYREAHHVLDRAYEHGWPRKLSWRHPPDRPALRILVGLGHLSYRKGNTAAAQKYYEEILSHDSKDELGVKRYLLGIEDKKKFEDV